MNLWIFEHLWKTKLEFIFIQWKMEEKIKRKKKEREYLFNSKEFLWHFKNEYKHLWQAKLEFILIQWEIEQKKKTSENTYSAVRIEHEFFQEGQNMFMSQKKIELTQKNSIGSIKKYHKQKFEILIEIYWTIVFAHFGRTQGVF